MSPWKNRLKTELGIVMLAALVALMVLVGGVLAGPAAAQETTVTAPAATTAATTAGAVTTTEAVTTTSAPVTPPAPIVAPTPVTVTGGAPVDVFRLNGDVVVAPGQAVKSVVAVNGRITVQGHVTETAFAANGDIVIADGGRVDGDAVTLTGRVRTEGTGSVGGSMVDTALRSANLSGFHPRIPGVGLFSWFFVTLGALGLGVLLALVAARSLDGVSREYVDHLGRSILIGFLSLLAVPAIFIVLLLSVVGIPLALLLFPAVFVMGLFGIYALSLLLGRRLLTAFNRPTAGDLWGMVAGILVIRVVLIIPVLSWFLFFIAGAVAFGATVSRLWDVYQARRATRPARPLPAAAPTAPAAPVAPGPTPPPVSTPPAPQQTPSAAAEAAAELPAVAETQTPPASQTALPPAAEEPAVPGPEAPSGPPLGPGPSEPRFHI
jgi:hypothetical protein